MTLRKGEVELMSFQRRTLQVSSAKGSTADHRDSFCKTKHKTKEQLVSRKTQEMNVSDIHYPLIYYGLGKGNEAIRE